MFLQRLQIPIAASGIVAAAVFTATQVTAEDSPRGPTATRELSSAQVPSRLDQPPSRPIFEKPFAQGPNRLLLFRPATWSSSILTARSRKYWFIRK